MIPSHDDGSFDNHTQLMHTRVIDIQANIISKDFAWLRSKFMLFASFYSDNNLEICMREMVNSMKMSKAYDGHTHFPDVVIFHGFASSRWWYANFLEEVKINLPYMFKLRQYFSQIVMNQNSKSQNYVSSIYLYGKEFVVQECNGYL